MSILSGYTRYKRHILTSEGYKLCSQWTSSNSVVMGDGTDDTNTLETNLGSIKGITDSLTATSSNIALSASAGNNLQSQVDTLNSNLAWKLVSSVTGQEKVALPEDWNEINVIVKDGSNQFAFYVNKEMLSNINRITPRTGIYYTNLGYMVTLGVTATDVILSQMFYTVNGVVTDKSVSSTMEVYYR